MAVEDLQARAMTYLRGLPAPRALADGRASVRHGIDAAGVKLAVVDDDPTGTQTVRNVPLVTDWSEAELRWAMAAAAPTFGVLTNTRSLPEARAVEINTVIGQRLANVARRLGVQVRTISRSDSTLRGHFPAEPEALAAGLSAGGYAIDSVLLCPAFPEAGRVTADDVHWVVRAGQLIPAAQTEYAQDAAFGYRSSNLIDWVRERAGDEATVGSVGLRDIRRGGPQRVAERLLELGGTVRYIVANAAEAGDLDVLALGVQRAEQQGLRLVYRTGPSFVSARAGLATAKPLAQRDIAMPRGRGLVVVGSHTALTTAQLDEARRNHDLAMVALDVEELLAQEGGDRDEVVTRAAAALRLALAHGDAALVTSRSAAQAGPGAGSLQAAGTVAGALVDIVGAVAREVPLQWLVAKGGITSHDLAVRALRATRVTVLGQLFFGQISVWKLGEGSISPGLRYVVFPGNVGDESALARTLDRLKGAA